MIQNDPNDPSPYFYKYNTNNKNRKKKKKNKLDDFISSVQQLRYTYNPSSIKRRQIED